MPASISFHGSSENTFQIWAPDQDTPGRFPFTQVFDYYSVFLGYSTDHWHSSWNGPHTRTGQLFCPELSI